MKYKFLTDRHKDMLALLASGLHVGYTKPTWAIFFSGAIAYLIVGLDDRNRMSPSRKQMWYTVTYEDLNFFTEADLMRDLHHMAVSPNRYLQLNVERIIGEFLSETVSI